MFISPHKLAVDKEGSLWLADNGGHQVFKLSQDGKIAVVTEVMENLPVPKTR